MEILSVVAIIVAGLMVGSELAIAAFVHPTLAELPDDVHLPAASALARVLGSFMPFWYVLVFLLTAAEVVMQWRQSGRSPIWVAIAAALWLLAILYSVTVLVPINNRIKSMPPDWKVYRRRWDLLHRWRVLLLTIGFAFLIVGSVQRNRNLPAQGEGNGYHVTQLHQTLSPGKELRWNAGNFSSARPPQAPRLLFPTSTFGQRKPMLASRY